jgi:hypothetical protein
MKKTSEDFVRSLRKKIQDKKNEEIIQRNVLHNALDYFSYILCKEEKIELKEQKKYQNRDLKSSIRMYSENEDIPGLISEILTLSDMEFTMKGISDKIFLFVVNLGNNLVTSPKKNNWIVAEVKITGKYTFLVDVYLKLSDPVYSIYENKYFGIKIWICDNTSIFSFDISLLDCKREKSGIRRTLGGEYLAKIGFDSVGEVNQIKISKKSGAKTKNVL